MHVRILLLAPSTQVLIITIKVIFRTRIIAHNIYRVSAYPDYTR